MAPSALSATVTNTPPTTSPMIDIGFGQIGLNDMDVDPDPASQGTNDSQGSDSSVTTSSSNRSSKIEDIYHMIERNEKRRGKDLDYVIEQIDKVNKNVSEHMRESQMSDKKLDVIIGLLKKLNADSEPSNVVPTQTTTPTSTPTDTDQGPKNVVQKAPSNQVDNAERKRPSSGQDESVPSKNALMEESQRWPTWDDVLINMRKDNSIPSNSTASSNPTNFTPSSINQSSHSESTPTRSFINRTFSGRSTTESRRGVYEENQCSLCSRHGHLTALCPIVSSFLDRSRIIESTSDSHCIFCHRKLSYFHQQDTCTAALCSFCTHVNSIELRAHPRWSCPWNRSLDTADRERLKELHAKNPSDFWCDHH